MRSFNSLAVAAVSFISAFPSVTATFGGFKNSIRTVDVAILGGGAGGTHAAIQLKDAKKTVLVIEKQDRLGGHTETYIDPSHPESPLDLGVIFWHNQDWAKRYISRLGVNYTELPPPQQGGPGAAALIFDFSTGKLLTGLPEPTQEQIGTAIQTYIGLLQKYHFLARGYFLPEPVPEELLLPFGEFVTKYNLQPLVVTLFEYPGALGDILKIPTMYVLAVMGESIFRSLTGAGFVAAASHRNSDLYLAAEKELNSSNSLLLSSEVIFSERDAKDSHPIKLFLRTPSGLRTVFAKKLLVAIPPTLSNLRPVDLSKAERQLFKKWSAVGYYTGVLRNTGIPDNMSLTNLGENTTYHLPSLPGEFTIGSANGVTVPGYKQVFYGTPLDQILSEEQAKKNIIDDIKDVQRGSEGRFPQTEPEFVVFKSHTPFNLQVSSEEIKNGFYRKLYALQGQRNTFWTGGAFRSQDSSMIWQFNENEVLPALLKSLSEGLGHL
ncbi:FAD/NAD(P)-binding domain-containing protein [Delitschia confertaspora ATCC 74209]|uniref:FAD/NAD(P)-binding domain-containing protein n=1 Tax=Delitschia confertaspora ATCC 74209 TaxID=1513339 RepID=A0A9P4JRV1_9PLEO|nr:FAD/NAD(P)-binding domain-containing protein [Delitschia confertaspora ATCC 74209]